MPIAIDVAVATAIGPTSTVVAAPAVQAAFVQWKTLRVAGVPAAR